VSAKWSLLLLLSCYFNAPKYHRSFVLASVVQGGADDYHTGPTRPRRTMRSSRIKCGKIDFSRQCMVLVPTFSRRYSTRREEWRFHHLLEYVHRNDLMWLQVAKIVALVEPRSERCYSRKQSSLQVMASEKIWTFFAFAACWDAKVRSPLVKKVICNLRAVES